MSVVLPSPSSSVHGSATASEAGTAASTGTRARIRCEGITKYYGHLTVLDAVDLTVHAGRMVGLVGPGGAGKSLLVKIICGLVEPDAGRVLIDGVDLAGLSEPQLQEVRSHLGMVFQNYALFDFMNVAENLALPLRMAGEKDESFIAKRVAGLLEQVALPGIQLKFPNELSGGMKKRVSFARAVIQEPPIVIYDDPTAGLDPVTSDTIFRLLADMQAKGTTSITISHDVAGIAPLCDEWMLLDHGQVIFQGSPVDFSRAEHPIAQAFWREVEP